MLRGNQVTLRPMAAGDLESLVDLFAVPEVVAWWPGENLPRLEARLTGDDEGVGLVIEPGDAPLRAGNDGTWRDSLLMDLLAGELGPSPAPS